MTENIYVNEGVPLWQGVPSLKIDCKDIYSLRMDELKEKIIKWHNDFGMDASLDSPLFPQIYLSIKACAYNASKHSEDCYILFGLSRLPMTQDRNLEIGLVCDKQFCYIFRIEYLVYGLDGIGTQYELRTPTIDLDI